MEKEESAFLVYFGMLFFILGLNIFATMLPANTTWITIWGTIITIVGILIIREGLKK